MHWTSLIANYTFLIHNHICISSVCIFETYNVTPRMAANACRNRSCANYASLCAFAFIGDSICWIIVGTWCMCPPTKLMILVIFCSHSSETEHAESFLALVDACMGVTTDASNDTVHISFTKGFFHQYRDMLFGQGNAYCVSNTTIYTPQVVTAGFPCLHKH